MSKNEQKQIFWIKSDKISVLGNNCSHTEPLIIAHFKPVDYEKKQIFFKPP